MSVGIGLMWFGLALLCFIGVTVIILTGDRIEERAAEESEEAADAIGASTVRPEVSS